MKNRLGQLLLIDVPRAVWNPTLDRLLQKFQPAGILFRHLTPATADVFAECVRILDLPPFLAIEEEGGGSLGDVFPALPPLARLDANGAERVGDLIGRAMALLGLNLNLAPSVDLPVNRAAEAKEAVADVSQTVTPAEIARRAQAFVGGLARHRILACARHFPGLPVTDAARSSPAPIVDRPMATLWREDLVPYRTLGPACGMIQVTHAVHKAYDYEFPRPASLSPNVVEGLLRVKLGYQGVALADLGAASRAAGIGLGEAAVRAVAAGCDLLLVPGEQKQLTTVLDSLERGVEHGTLGDDRVAEAMGRLGAARKKLAKPGNSSSGKDLARLNREFADFSARWAAGASGTKRE